jgi:chromosome partitioning protein
MNGDGMRIISIVSQKGGCGKTTTSVNLASYLALMGNKVLLIDLDPQGSSTTHFGIAKGELKKTTKDMIDSGNFEDTIVHTGIDGLDIVPTDSSLSDTEKLLAKEKFQELKLKRRLSCLTGYDYVIIDTQPSLGNLTENAIIACDEIIIPIKPAPFSVEGLTMTTELLDIMSEFGYQPRRRYLLTMCTRNKKVSKRVMGDVREIFGADVFETIIPENVKLEEAPGEGKPICLYEPACKGAKAYQNLAKEVAGCQTRTQV